MESTQPLVDELVAAREEFLAALDAVDPELLNTPGLLGEWSARELTAHLGYWAGDSVESIHAVEDGRASEYGAERRSVDEINETVARVARETDLATVRKREAASYETLLERLRRLDPSLLPTPLPHYGITLEEAIREDGPEHYRNHAADVRAWFDGEDDPADDPGEIAGEDG
jgi:hypothetical protein